LNKAAPLCPAECAPSWPLPSHGGARILGVGVATLDQILEVAEYPLEDSEIRALAQRQVRGGNAANTLAVLAQIGHHCAWVGALADDPAGTFVRFDLEGRGIHCGWATVHPDRRTPTSYVILCRATGSRTIVHYRDLPELTAADFERVPLGGWDWVHFEGRNAPETARMIERVRRESPGTPISVELEKPRPEIERLLVAPDLLLVSRELAIAQNRSADDDPGGWLTELADRSGARLLALGWGANGAWLLEKGRGPLRLPARPLARVIDTLGAGDVLNAGMIHGLLAGLGAEEALGQAVTLAGLKCTREGLDGLVEDARAQGML
jgi:ketohexokinase